MDSILDESLKQIIRIDVGKALKQIQDTAITNTMILQRYAAIQCNAAVALGELGDARAVEPLITSLKNTDSSVRCYAVEALGKLGDAESRGTVDWLFERSGMECAKRRFSCAREIWRCAGRGTIDWLLEESEFYFPRNRC